MIETENIKLTQFSHGAGCGCKIAPDVLERMLHTDIEQAKFKSLLVGNVVAFVIAFLTMRFFVDFLKKHGFRFFGWYRICAGIVFLLMVKMNQIR